ncbi:MAG: amidase [Proteobacteria bacterium]|nr:amidase [Pseudomonadota bacterium]
MRTRRDLLQMTVAGLATSAAACVLSDRSAQAASPANETTKMTQRPLHYQTLSEVAMSIAEGSLSSVQVTKAMLKRIASLEPRLHSYYTVMGEQALQAAAVADAAREQGEHLGSLHGVPIAVKDLCHKRGAPTTAGHSFRKDLISTTDATVVTRLEAQGAVILGKLATTEGAMVGYHRDFAVPRNPWGDLDRWPGVSSGGSGVATAAGLCFASLGTDTGGSIRFPSAVNGIVGLKPTWGRVSRHGVLDLGPTLDHVGPMTRSVRDAARILSAIAGHDANDPTSLAAPVPDYEKQMERGVAALRIGWDEAFATRDVEPFVADAMHKAIALFKSQGAEIVNIQFPTLEPEENAAWNTLAAAEAAAVHEATFPSQQDAYGTYFREFLTQGRDTSSVTLAKAMFARKRASGRVAPIFAGIDCLVCPTLASESFRYNPEDAYGGLDLTRGTIGGVPLEFFNRSGRFVTIWDYNGYPTLSVPCGFSPERIPISLQLIASPLNEGILCQAGYAFEQANEFHLQHPQLT